MVDITLLHPGDVVRIVSERTGEYWDPNNIMTYWLGHEMTVKDVNLRAILPYVTMEEDQDEHCGGGWCWHPRMIDCVVSFADEQNAVILPSEGALDALLYGCSA